jgi:hypothetical protein
MPTPNGQRNGWAQHLEVEKYLPQWHIVVSRLPTQGVPYDDA